MKKKYFLQLILTFVVICYSLSGCQNLNKIEENMSQGIFSVYNQSVIDDMYTERFQFEDRLIKKENSVFEYNYCSGKNIKGILTYKDKLILTDSSNNKLIILNQNGDLLQEVGKIGNASREFLNPTGIAVYQDEIYILDSGNSRIQILDENGSYLREILLPQKDREELLLLCSMAINAEGDIFMSSIDFRCPYILCYESSTGEFTKIGKNFIGTVASYKDKVYAVNIGLVTGKNEKSALGIRTGINYLYSLSASGMQSICELPYGITVTGFTVTDDKIICVSGTYHTVEVYSLQGVYQYSLAKTEEIGLSSSLGMDLSGGVYVGLESVKKFYYIKNDMN